MIVLPYTGFPYSSLVRLWKGVVKVDGSLADKTSSWLDFDDYRVFTINDSKYRYQDNAQLDNYEGAADFPNEITLFVSGNEILEQMQCTVVKGYKEQPSKKLLQRSQDVHKRLACKGLILEPTRADDSIDVDACLGLLQFDNEYGQEISFDRLGIHAFTSGSQTSKVTLRNPRRSVTTIFIASKEKPLVTYVYLKDKILKFFCDDSGIKITQVRERKQDEPYGNKKIMLEILKTRLVKGEITVEEYERVKRIILDDENYTSNWI